MYVSNIFGRLGTVHHRMHQQANVSRTAISSIIVNCVSSQENNLSDLKRQHEFAKLDQAVHCYSTASVL